MKTATTTNYLLGTEYQHYLSTMAGRGAVQRQSFFVKYKGYLISLAVLVVGIFIYGRYKSRKGQNAPVKIREAIKARNA